MNMHIVDTVYLYFLGLSRQATCVATGEKTHAGSLYEFWLVEMLGKSDLSTSCLIKADLKHHCQTNS